MACDSLGRRGESRTAREGVRVKRADGKRDQQLEEQRVTAVAGKTRDELLLSFAAAMLSHTNSRKGLSTERGREGERLSVCYFIKIKCLVGRRLPGLSCRASRLPARQALSPLLPRAPATAS